MPSLILNTRLEILSSNLRDVKDVMELAKRRGQQIQDLQESLFKKDNGVRALASELKKSVDLSLVHLRSDDELREQQPVHDAIDTLERTADLFADMVTQLETCHKALETLLGARVELSTRKIQERLPDIADARIRDMQWRLDASAAHPSGWDLEKQLSAQSEPLFAEYVDLLRGLALRESGIERGICELADRLLDGCDRSAKWKSVAIPSYRGPSELTPAQIIRMGFPEWTIWALPLAAYEFGRLMVTQDATLNGKIASEAAARGIPESALVDSLADALATYAVGPAYACAAILMRLNPRPSVAGGPPADDARAQMIFAMLKISDDAADSGTSFESLLTQLDKAWKDALAETGATAGDGKSAADLAQFFWSWAKTNYVTARYQPTSWMVAQKLKDLLAQRIGPPLSTDDRTATSSGPVDVRDMLNAAWPLRLEDPDKADKIAEAVLAVWQEMNARPQKVTRFASRAAQPSVQRRTS